MFSAVAREIDLVLFGIPRMIALAFASLIETAVYICLDECLCRGFIEHYDVLRYVQS